MRRAIPSAVARQEAEIQASNDLYAACTRASCVLPGGIPPKTKTSGICLPLSTTGPATNRTIDIKNAPIARSRTTPIRRASFCGTIRLSMKFAHASSSGFCGAWSDASGASSRAEPGVPPKRSVAKPVTGSCEASGRNNSRSLSCQSVCLHSISSRSRLPSPSSLAVRVANPPTTGNGAPWSAYAPPVFLL